MGTEMLPATTDDSLLDNFSPGDLYRYRRVSKDCKEAVDSYIRRHFRLHDFLGRYFDSEDDIIQFRCLQYTTGMFISGSAALQFLDRTTYPDSDLDLYVEHRFRWVIAYWLVGVGYRYKAGTIPPNTLDDALGDFPDIPRYIQGRFYDTTPKGYSGAAMIINFEKLGSPPRKVQLITKQHAMLQMVLNFHSTCVMNLITHEKAYSIFPRATFDERRSLLQLPMDRTRQQVATTKYTSRGFTVIPKISLQRFNDPNSSFMHGKRHLGDRKCWTLPILPKLELPQSTIEANSWALLYGSNLYPYMMCTAFGSATLRFGYLVVDANLRNYVAEVSNTLRRRFDRLITDDERNNGLDHIFTIMIEQYRSSEDQTERVETGIDTMEIYPPWNETY